jgi:hypothetical protein
MSDEKTYAVDVILHQTVRVEISTDDIERLENVEDALYEALQVEIDPFNRYSTEINITRYTVEDNE